MFVSNDPKFGYLKSYFNQNNNEQLSSITSFGMSYEISNDKHPLAQPSQHRNQ